MSAPPRASAPALPPASRSRAGLGLTASAARGRFELQVCRECGTVQYPPREACRRCLSVQLDWKPQSGDGALLAETRLFHSNDEFFRARLPWRIGMIRLDCAATVVAHLHGAVSGAGTRVRVGARLDKAGQGALIAFPVDEVSNMADDRQLREMSCDPRLRKVLVTDGTNAVGQSLVRALLAAGASHVWAGCPDSRADAPAVEALKQVKDVSVLSLDVTDARSVQNAAAQIGADVEILINNAEYRRASGLAAPGAVDSARSEMDVSYFGSLHLAQELGPLMRARAADGKSPPIAWVNILSVFALSSFPGHGAFSASKAAAFSLAQCQRAELAASGIRVVNVFPGPIDDGRNQSLPQPKLSADALAGTVVKALQDGIEDVYPGDVAQEWFARWRDNPKVLERELAAGRW